MENKKINFIVPFYNCAQFLDRCVSSVMTQKYPNFHVYFIDDCSDSDDAFRTILPHEDKRATCIRNTTRVTALENIHNTIMNYCEPDSITALLDGDDHLISNKVASIINSIFEEKGVWISYGSCVWSDGSNRDFSCAYTEEEYANVRKARFKVSHLRAFYAGLYKKIEEQDKDFAHLKDSAMNFYRWGYDTPLMFALMDMTPFSKCYYNSINLISYNRNNDLSEDKINQTAQTNVHIDVSKKTPLKKINSYL